jgi:uncharacterized membrane protein YeaQ/YmgE (transglycosylase-associated protein family)
MGIFLWIVFGVLAGWVASLIMDTNTQQGLLLNMVIGIFGAMLGGWLMSYMGGTGITGFNLYSLLVAILGAVVLIIGVQAIRSV